MAVTLYNCTALTGGAARALDSYSVANLVNGDRAMVVTGGKFYFYIYNSTGTAAENSPLVIRPDNYSTGGNWELAGSPYGDLAIMPQIVSGLSITGGITGGDVTVSGNTMTITPTTCLDSGLTTKLYTSANATCVIPSVANTDYYGFLVKLVSGGTFEFRPYTTLAGVASDTQVDKSRLISYCKTDGSGVVMPFRQVAESYTFTTSAMPTVTASMTTSFVSYTLSTIIPVTIFETIKLQATDIAAIGFVASYDGTDTASWLNYGGAVIEIVSVSAIYLKYYNINSPVKVRGMRIRR